MEFKGCRKCIKSKMLGYVKNTNTGFYEECSCHKKWRLDGVIKARCSKAGLSSTTYFPLDDYIGTKSIQSVHKIVKFAVEFDNKFHDKTLYLYGPNGTQKSTLANWIGVHLIKSGKSVKSVMMQTLIEDLMPNFDNQESSELKFKEYVWVDCLIIDESFSKDKVNLYKSGFQLPFFDRFIRERIEIQKKATVFVSNISPNKIEENKFSLSIQDLILRNTVSKCSALLLEDNYQATKVDFDSEDIFK